MKEYIDRGALLKELERFPHLQMAGSIVRSISKEDVAPLVRCKDCKYFVEEEFCMGIGIICKFDDFCSYGERKEQK